MKAAYLIRRIACWIVAGLGLSGVAHSADEPANPAATKPAADKPAPAGSSLDDELFKDLDGNGKTSGLKPKTASAASKPASAPSATTPAPAQPATTAPATTPATTKPAAKPLDPLDAELFKQLDGEPPPKEPPPDKPAGANKPAGEPGDDGEKPAAESEADDPFSRVSRKVRDAEARLARTDSGEETQELQRGIVKDLDDLIAQIEQSMQQSKSQSKSSPSSRQGNRQSQQQRSGGQGEQPADNPTGSNERLVDRRAVRPDPAKMQELVGKEWGSLPDQVRQDIVQFSFEDFPLKYQYVIEEYFKALLKERD